MAKVLMIGAGGVATVAAFKIAQNADVFTDFMIASRRKAKCDKIVEDIHKAGYKMDIKTAQVDADDVEQLKALFNSYQPELVINLALPYQDLTIMDACLACGCSYLDTANYEPKDEAHFEYSWQWAYRERPPISTLRSISVRLPKRDFTGKMASGLRQNLWRSTKISPIPTSAHATAICCTTRKLSRWSSTTPPSSVHVSG